MKQTRSIFFSFVLASFFAPSLHDALLFRRKALASLPSDVDPKHPCVGVMRETQQACEGEPGHRLKYGESNFDCNFNVCVLADLNRERCADVATDGTPTTKMFPEDLDKLLNFHGIDCEKVPNAAQDCGKAEAQWEEAKSKASGGSSLVQKEKGSGYFNTRYARWVKLVESCKK